MLTTAHKLAVGEFHCRPLPAFIIHLTANSVYDLPIMDTRRDFHGRPPDVFGLHLS